jgi:hypothetical protein
MIGAEDVSLRGVVSALNQEGVKLPASTNNKSGRWGVTFVRDHIVKDDLYKPHTFEELKEILSEPVLATLDPTKAYGVYYFNRERITRRQVAEETPEGRVYRKKSKRAIKDRSEWIAIPVPDAGIPREWVDAARSELDGNKQCSKADDKFWELSGGIMRCGYCGRRMTAQVTSYKRKDGRKSRYHYYRCQKAVTHKELCPYRKSYNANKLEEKVWDLVSDFLKDPERLRAGLEEKIRRDEEAASLNRNPEKQIRVWRERIAAGQEKRRRYQEMAAEGLIDFDELRERISELDEEKRLAEEEINALRRQNERLEAMRRDKDTLLARLMELTPEEMDKLSPEQRHWIYRRLGLAVTTRPDGTLDIYGELTDLIFSNVEVASRCRGRP